MDRHRVVAALAGAVLLTALVMAPDSGTASSVAAAGCPTGPVTITKLVHLADTGRGLECYGGRRLVFRAFVPPPCDGCGGTSAFVLSPSWLNGLSEGEIVLSTGKRGAEMVAFIPPALGTCGDESACPLRWYRGRWATFSAHFDGPVARTCRYVEHPPGPGFSKADAVADCRHKLIILSVGPVVDVPATDTTSTGGMTSMTTPILGVVMAVVALILVSHRRRFSN